MAKEKYWYGTLSGMVVICVSVVVMNLILFWQHEVVKKFVVLGNMRKRLGNWPLFEFAKSIGIFQAKCEEKFRTSSKLEGKSENRDNLVLMNAFEAADTAAAESQKKVADALTASQKVISKGSSSGGDNNAATGTVLKAANVQRNGDCASLFESTCKSYNSWSSSNVGSDIGPYNKKKQKVNGKQLQNGWQGFCRRLSGLLEFNPRVSLLQTIR
ncbi:hypothetical protein Tco_0741112 [Tanacetum coccineum]